MCRISFKERLGKQGYIEDVDKAISTPVVLVIGIGKMNIILKNLVDKIYIVKLSWDA